MRNLNMLLKLESDIFFSKGNHRLNFKCLKKTGQLGVSVELGHLAGS